MKKDGPWAKSWLMLLHQNMQDLQGAFGKSEVWPHTVDFLPSKNDRDWNTCSSLLALPMEKINMIQVLSVRGLGVVTLKQTCLLFKSKKPYLLELLDSLDSATIWALGQSWPEFSARYLECSSQNCVSTCQKDFHPLPDICNILQPHLFRNMRTALHPFICKRLC